MSPIKTIILKLLQNTNIAARFRRVLELYKDNAEYAKLAYHNVDHVAAVLNLFEVLRKLTGKQFSKRNLEVAYLAAAFHDINHTGHPDTNFVEHDNNISLACRRFREWAEIENNLDSEIADDVTMLIYRTQYPREHAAFTETRVPTGELAELADMLCDADMLWGTMPGNAEPCMLGMWAERRNADLESEEIDILKILTNQIKFIQSYVPRSAVGRKYKKAMFDDASAAWALVALQYQRQIEAAEVVKELSDTQVLTLNAAMRPHITQKMLGGVKRSIATPTEFQEG